VIEDVRLDLLVSYPIGGFREHVDLYRHAGGAGCLLPDEEGQPLLVNVLVVVQVGFDVCPESAQVRQLPPVQRAVHLDALLTILALDLRQTVVEVVPQDVHFPEALDHRCVAEADGAQVDID